MKIDSFTLKLVTMFCLLMLYACSSDRPNTKTELTSDDDTSLNIAGPRNLKSYFEGIPDRFLFELDRGEDLILEDHSDDNYLKLKNSTNGDSYAVLLKDEDGQKEYMLILKNECVEACISFYNILWIKELSCVEVTKDLLYKPSQEFIENQYIEKSGWENADNLHYWYEYQPIGNKIIALIIDKKGLPQILFKMNWEYGRFTLED